MYKPLERYNGRAHLTSEAVGNIDDALSSLNTELDINSSNAYVNVGVHNISSGFVGIRIAGMNADTHTVYVDNFSDELQMFAGQDASIFMNNQRNYVNVLTIPENTDASMLAIKSDTIPKSVFDEFNNPNHRRPAWLYFANKDLNQKMIDNVDSSKYENIEFDYIGITITPSALKDVYVRSGEREWTIKAGTNYAMLELIDGATFDEIKTQIEDKLVNVSYESAVTELNRGYDGSAFTTSSLDITRGSNEDKIISEVDNLLRTATCSRDDLPSVLYNGKLTGVTANYDWADAYGWTKAGAPFYVTYKLDTVYDITDIIVSGAGTGAFGVNGFKVYVGNKDGSQIKNDPTVGNLVYSTTDNVVYGRHVSVNPSVRGQYVVFELCGKNGGTYNSQLWLSELSVKGNVAAEKMSIDAENNKDNIITNNILSSAKITSSSYLSTAMLVDSKYSEINTAYSNSTCWSPTANKSEHPDGYSYYVTFELPRRCAITSFMLAGSGKGSYGVGSYDVYVDKKYTDLTDADRPIYSCSDAVVFGEKVNFHAPIVTDTLTVRAGAQVNGNYWQVWVSEIAATVLPAVTLTTIGDSITAGFHFVDDNHGQSFVNSYANLLGSALSTFDEFVTKYINISDGGTTVVPNSGANGNEESWLANNLSKVCYTDRLTIMLGTNDAAYKSWNSDHEELFKQKYLEIISAFKALNPNVEIFIITPTAYMQSVTYKNNNITTHIIPCLKEVASETGSVFIDVFTPTYGVDNVIDSVDVQSGLGAHLSEYGHEVVYDVVSEYVISGIKEYSTNSTDGHPGMLSYVTGYRNVNTGYRSLVFGGRNIVNSDSSFAGGYKNQALGYMSTALGYGNRVEGAFDFTLGNGNYAPGTQDLSSGTVPQHRYLTGANNQVLAPVNGVWMMGSNLKTTTGTQFIFGTYNNTNPDALFIVGNGTNNSRSNAFVINRDGSATLKHQGNTADSIVRKDYVDTEISKISSPDLSKYATTTELNNVSYGFSTGLGLAENRISTLETQLSAQDTETWTFTLEDGSTVTKNVVII